MPQLESLPVRRALRLPGFDYSTPRAYFVTMCTAHRAAVFGRVVAGRVRLTACGRAVVESWRWVCESHPWVRVRAGVVMPDHVHVIVALGPSAPWRKPLGRIVGAVKSRSTRRINELWGTTEQRVWQRGFHDRVIRDAVHMERCRRYIAENPARWTARQGAPNL